MLVGSRLVSVGRLCSRGTFASAKALGASLGFANNEQAKGGAMAGGAKASGPTTRPSVAGQTKPATFCAFSQLQLHRRSMTMSSSGPTKPPAGFVTIIQDGFKFDVSERMMYQESGEGEMHTHNGHIYIGAWQNGKKNGKGILRTHSIANSPDTVYEGIWVNDILEGQVKVAMTRKDAAEGAEEPIFVYEGLLVNGKRHGPGVVTTKNYVLRVEYKKGHRAAKGVIEYPNGDRYEGGIFGGYPMSLLHHGHGKMTYANGEEADWEGMWSKGEKVEDDEGKDAGTTASKATASSNKGRTSTGGNRICDIINPGETHHEGTINYADGRVYEGEYELKTEPHGRGVMRYPDGSVYNGMWKDGKRYGE